MSTPESPTRRAYAAARRWYLQNIDRPIASGDEYRRASIEFVGALPEASLLSDIEISAVFREMIAGGLEWAYGSDGGREVIEAARAASGAEGRSYSLSPQELEQLQGSTLWRFMKR